MLKVEYHHTYYTMDSYGDKGGQWGKNLMPFLKFYFILFYFIFFNFIFIIIIYY